MDLEKKSYIETFHFVDKIVFFALFNKQHLWFWHKMHYLLPRKTYRSSLHVLLLRSDRLLCNGYDTSIFFDILIFIDFIET